MNVRRDRWAVRLDDMLTLRVRPSLLTDLERVADQLEVSRSDVAREALQRYVADWHDRQTPEPAA